MFIGIQGKLNELSSCQKTDGSIQAEYNQLNSQYHQVKAIYKSSRDEYKAAQQQLDIAKENFRNAPLVKMFSANRQVKLAKRNLKQAKQKFQEDKQRYKQKLQELRRLKSEIRGQYRSHRDYAKFFKKVQEAQKMGIALPKYITDEYTKQKATYLSEKYTVNRTGRSYITPPDTSCSKDVSTLIWQKEKEDLRTTFENVKEKLTHKDKDDGIDRG